MQRTQPTPPIDHNIKEVETFYIFAFQLTSFLDVFFNIDLNNY